MAAFVIGPLLADLLLAAAGVGATGRRDSGHDNDASPRRVTVSPVGGYSEESKYELRAGAFVVIASTSSSVSS
jgi:hypothetical protein